MYVVNDGTTTTNGPESLYDEWHSIAEESATTALASEAALLKSRVELLLVYGSVLSVRLSVCPLVMFVWLFIKSVSLGSLHFTNSMEFLTIL